MHHKTKLIKLALILFAGIVLTLPVNGQTPQERHARIKAAMESSDVHAAAVELTGLRSDSTVFAANNYDYLLGRLQEKSGDLPGAAASYQSVVNRNSQLSQYALWHLAQIARTAGDLKLERERLNQLIKTAPASLLREAATLRLGRSFFDSKDYIPAIDTLRPLSESAPRAIAREALAFIGESLLRSGRRDEARNVFRGILTQMPDASRPDDFALAAVRALDSTESSQTQSVRLPESEHLLRASVYQFNRDFDAARSHFLAVVQHYPQSPTVANSLYEVGRGHYQQGKYDEALRYFQRVMTEFPNSASTRDANTFSAGAYNRLKRTDDAVTAYKLFIARFPDTANPERPYLNIIDALHEAGRHKEALDWVGQTRWQFTNRLGDALALFAQTRIHMAQSAWASVITDTNELRKLQEQGGTRTPGGTTPSEITFLRAYALQRLGRVNEAIAEYLSIPDGRNEYYGKRATQRLLAMAADAKTRALVEAHAKTLRNRAEAALVNKQFEDGRKLAQKALRLTTDEALRNETLELVMRAYDELPAYKFPTFNLLPLGRQEVITEAGPATATHEAIAQELFFLGLYDEAVPEFAAARSASASAQSDLDYSLAVYALRGGLANRAVRFAEQVWKPIPSDYVFEFATQQMVDLLYPLPFRESLLKHASPRGVDPRLVISIARQESRFQPDAKSIAAARGLMQFIPETANAIAGQLEIREFNQDQLYNADTAILFGSQYLANLFKEFPGQPQAVVGAYNGGPHNLARWIARSKSNEADRYVPEIGFSQTKDYVYKVMANFWVYEQLYDEKLNRK